MTGSRKPAATRRTSATAVAAAASAVSATLLLVVVLVCHGTSGSSGNGRRAGPHLGRTDEPRSGAGEEDAAASSAAAAAAAVAAVAAARAWVPRDAAERSDALLGGAAARRGSAFGAGTGLPSGTAGENRTNRSDKGPQREDESGLVVSSVLYGTAAAANANAPRLYLPHDTAAATEAGWATRRKGEIDEEERRGSESRAEGGGLRGGGESRLYGVRKRRRHERRRQRRLSRLGEEQATADDEQDEARGIAAVVAEEEGARHEGDGGGDGVFEGWMTSRSLGASKFGHPSDRCFSAGEGGRTRCHANIFFFGVSKCGTTSLAHWMAEHPEVHACNCLLCLDSM